MRYVVALLAKFPDSFIQEAQKQFATDAIGYLLSKNSLPHITLAQFYLNDANVLLELWHKIKDAYSASFQPTFIGVSLTKKSQYLWGVSLLVDRDPHLVAQHTTIAEILKRYHIDCINNVGERYRPHLTLSRIKEPKIVNFNDHLLKNAPFVLALGRADVNGQYLSTVYE